MRLQRPDGGAVGLKQLHRGVADFGDRLGDGAAGRGEQGRHAVVIADDRNVVGHPEATGVQLLQDPRGQDVRPGDDRGRHQPVEHPSGEVAPRLGQLARGIGIGPEAERQVAGGEAGLGGGGTERGKAQRLFIAGQADLYLRFLRAADEADAPVAQVDQVAQRGAHAGQGIDADERRIGQRPPFDLDQGNPRLLQPGEIVQRQRVAQKDRLDPVFEELAHARRLILDREAVVDGQQRIAPRGGGLADGMADMGKDRIHPGRGQDQPQRLAEICAEAGLPDGVVNIVTGDGAAGAALVEHPDVDKIGFTGSTATGKAIVRAAAGNLKRVSLELGGKSPVFIFPDADLDSAIPGAAEAVMLNSGQACTAGSRVYIHEDIYDRVIEGIAAYAEGLKLGHGLAEGTNLGPIISQKQFARVTGLLDSGRAEGASFVTGGDQTGLPGFFLRPTLLAGVTPEMTVYREEIFGPVISAMKMTSANVDALAREANNTTYGLAASIWTRDLQVAHKLAARIRAGIIWINNHNQSDANLPWGGFKQSGWGREMGKPAVDLYTEVKSVGVYLGE